MATIQASGVGANAVGGQAKIEKVQAGRLDFLPNIKVETLQKGRICLQIPTITALTNEGPWIFRVEPLHGHAVMLNHTVLYTKSKIMRTNEDEEEVNMRPDSVAPPDLPDLDNVTYVNSFSHAIQQNVQVYANGRPLPPELGFAANYKAVIEDTTSMSLDARLTHGEEIFFHEDRPGKMNVKEVHTNTANPGFNARYTRTAGSHEVETMGRVCHPFLMVDNYYPAPNNFQLEIIRPSDRFLLSNGKQGTRKYRIIFTEITLMITYIRLAENYVPPMIQNYQMNYTVLRQIPLNRNTWAKVIPFNAPGQVMPRRALIVMTRHDAVFGDEVHNPWNFEHFNVANMSFLVDGVRYPNGGLKFDWSQLSEDPHSRIPHVLKGYHHLNRNIGMWMPNKGSAINFDAYYRGKFVNAWDLNPDMCGGGHNHEAQKTQLELDLTFKEGLVDNIMVHAYFSKKVILTINSKTGDFAINDLE